MKIWMKKITVFLVAILTLGLYVPPLHIDAELDKADKGEVTPNENDDTSFIQQVAVLEDGSESAESSNQLYLQTLNEQAKEQVLAKLGQKISHQIDTELNNVVWPNMELVLDHLYEQLGEEKSQYLMISEDPASGYGERIFNLYDTVKKQDVATFHVNRVKRPQEGYYFQFHYHLQNDNFEEHYTIGDVHWGKNTPPKWMS